MAQGKIVVEESPLTTFFNRTLPDWSMNLLSMQARMTEAEKAREFSAAEAEKQRDFRESQTYLADLLSTQKMFREKILDAAQTATESGLNTESMYRKLFPEQITEGGMNLVEHSKKMDEHNSGLPEMSSVLASINELTNFANLGQQYAHAVDQNEDGTASLEELITFEKQSGQKMPKPDAMTEEGWDAFRKGANHYLGTKEGRVATQEYKAFSNALNLLDMYDMDPQTPGYQFDPNHPQIGELNKAAAAIEIGGQSPSKERREEIMGYITKAHDEPTGVSTDGLSAADAQFDLDAKTQYQFVQDRSAKMSTKLQAKIGQTFQQEAPKGSFANNPDAWLRKIEPVLEEFLLNKKGIDEQGLLTHIVGEGEIMKRTYKKHRKALEGTGTVDEIRANAIQKTLSDPDFIKRIENAGSFWNKSLFDVPGGKDYAADNFFKELITLYSMINLNAGKDTRIPSWAGDEVTFNKSPEALIFDNKTGLMMSKEDYNKKYGIK